MYVSDEIKADYKKWKSGDIVLIHAQTGAGKTYFILNTLLPYVASQGKSLLYLSNRSALRDQINLSYSQEYASSITVRNYQSFEQVDLKRKMPSTLGDEFLSCEYWVMDEAHYFLSDAFFNINVYSCMTTIKESHPNHVLIFMTATPEYLFLALGSQKLLGDGCSPPSFEWDTGGHCFKLGYNCNSWLDKADLVFQLSSIQNLLTFKEATDSDKWLYFQYLEAKSDYESNPNDCVYETAWQQMRPYQNIVSPDEFQNKFASYADYFDRAKSKLKIYKSASGYNFVHPIYFKGLDQLFERISKTPKSEKWLIFVSSKKRGEEIRTRLSNNHIPSVLITAETKHHKIARSQNQPEDYEAYQSIINKAFSPARVTISTSVLDNGVNLKDPCLKHIVLFEMNPTTFVQMLGRKRVEPGEQIHVYLQMRDIGEIKAYFQRTILQYVKFIAELKFVNDQAFEYRNSVEPFVLSNLQSFEDTYQVNGHFKVPFAYYVTQISKRANIQSNYPAFLCRYFQPNPITTIQLAYNYYRMLAVLEIYTNTPEKNRNASIDSLWIEHQLSWLGLEYDRKCWIDYPKYVRSKKIISRILSKPIGSVLSKNEQKKLKHAVITMVKSSHPPMAVKIGKGSLRKINEALAELGYSQKIVSRNRSIKGNHRNYWVITDGTVAPK